jgi:hypothetical protein
MSQPALTFLEQKWALNGSSNRLIAAATQTTDRQQPALNDYDLHRNITPLGRRTLLSLGRYAYENIPQVRGMIIEQATFAALGIISQYYGENPQFKDLAENWILEHNKICDIRGQPFTMETMRRNHVIALSRDGEIFFLLTEGSDGYPLLQVIPAHRVGSPLGTAVVEGGPFDGARIIDGIIVDDYGRTIGYRVLLDDSGYVLSRFRDIPASDVIHSFIPEYPEQLRGLSPTGKGVFDFMDVNETRAFEKASLKLGSHYGMTIHNESGTVDKSKQVIRGATTSPDSTTGAAQGLSTQVVNGVGVYYFKAGTNQRIEPVKNDRPSANQQNFEAEVIRSAFFGNGWSVDFSLDPSKVGGAPMRVVVEKINRVIKSIQCLALEPVCRRIDGWRVAKAQKLKLLPDDPDWWKWEYQFPAEVTADKKYDSDVDIAEMRAGLVSPQKAIGKRGQYWEDTQDELIAYEKRLQERCKTEGVDPERIIWPTPNGPQANEQDPNVDALSENQLLKGKLDLFGVGVRAGTYTPTPDDEEFFRREAGLPSMPDAARKAWEKDKNVRRPITLAGEDGGRVPLGGAQQNAGE